MCMSGREELKRGMNHSKKVICAVNVLRSLVLCKEAIRMSSWAWKISYAIGKYSPWYDTVCNMIM